MRGDTLRYLFIDSSTSYLILSLIIDNDVKYYYNECVSKDMSSIIMVKIEEAFDKCKIKPSNLNGIFVVNGPGSFTGIRVGLTVAKVMAYTLNIPLFKLSSLEVMTSGFDTKVMALINARRGYVFAGGYENLIPIYKDSYVLLDDVKGYDYVSYDDLDVHTILPKVDILKVINKHKNDLPVNPHSLNPNYLKLTEAEEKLKHD